MRTQRTAHESPSAPSAQAHPEVDWMLRITKLEARVEHLDAALEGLQDSVHRQSVLEHSQIAELSRRTEPHEMARALSKDARRHGV
jgi:hypothetical protein